jgi:hypothetical protein
LSSIAVGSFLQKQKRQAKQRIRPEFAGATSGLFVPKENHLLAGKIARKRRVVASDL